MNNEFTPMARPCAERLDTPPMQFHQIAHDCQSDPESSQRKVVMAVPLEEQIENMRQDICCNADAGVPDTDQDFSTVLFHPYMNLAAFDRVFGGIVQHNFHHLGETDKINVCPHLLLWERNSKRLFPVITVAMPIRFLYNLTRPCVMREISSKALTRWL